MAAEQRRLLQNLLAAETLSSADDLRNPRLCRSFCVGFCVNELLLNTKFPLGACKKIHSARLREIYQNGDPIPEFERDFNHSLNLALKSRNLRAASLKENLEVPEAAAKERAQLQECYEKLQRELHLQKLELKYLGEKNLLETAAEQLPLLRDTQQQLEELSAKLKGIAEVTKLSDHQNLQVCPTCASYLSVSDTDKRLAHHFSGRLHRGFRQIEEASHRFTAG